MENRIPECNSDEDEILFKVCTYKDILFRDMMELIFLKA